MVKVSVIMPVFNAEKFIETACESLSNQTLKDIELICVNDGSTDNSSEKINELSNKYPFIKLFNQKNQGSGEARNNGLNKATGEYIAFLDADDIFIDDDALEKMYFYGVENDADMVSANLQRVSIDGELEENFNYVEGNYAYFDDFDIISPQEYGVPWAFYKSIFKRSFLNENYIRFPDLKRGQDPVFLAEVLCNVDKICVVPTDLYGYNYAAGGGANKKVNSYQKKYDYIKHFQDTFDILEENNFNELSDAYKERLYVYLNLKDNKEDRELFDIVHKIFGYNVNYYNSISEEWIYLRMNLINTNDKKIAKRNFEDLRFKMYEFTLNETIFFNNDLMIDFVELDSIFKNADDDSYFLDKVKKDNQMNYDNTIKLKYKIYDAKLEIKDFTIKQLEKDNISISNQNNNLLSEINNLKEELNKNSILNDELNDLKKENENLIKKNKNLDSDFRKLKSKNEKLDKLNKEILNSNSWKTTKPLRSVRHKFQGDK